MKSITDLPVEEFNIKAAEIFQQLSTGKMSMNEARVLYGLEPLPEDVTLMLFDTNTE